MNKKGIELSVNFMIVLIITLVVFGMAIYLLKMFFSTAVEIKENIDTQTEEEIQRVLFSGERVAIPVNKKEIRRGSSEVFGIGILNVDNSGPDFTVRIDLGKVIALDGISDFDSNLAVKKEYEKEIKNNQHVIISMPISSPRDSLIGTHIVNVCVFNTADCPCVCEKNQIDKTYDKSLHKIYVTVD